MPIHTWARDQTQLAEQVVVEGADVESSVVARHDVVVSGNHVVKIDFSDGTEKQVTVALQGNGIHIARMAEAAETDIATAEVYLEAASRVLAERRGLEQNDIGVVDAAEAGDECPKAFCV